MVDIAFIRSSLGAKWVSLVRVQTAEAPICRDTAECSSGACLAGAGGGGGCYRRTMCGFSTDGAILDHDFAPFGSFRGRATF